MKASPILQVLKYRHIRLTTKDVNKGFYKGNRTGSMGRHTKYGGYAIEWSKVRTYAVPKNLHKCELTPFVPETVRIQPTEYEAGSEGPRDPQLYIDNWKKNEVHQ